MVESAACKHCGELALNPPFCCTGCEAAYNIISGLGLKNYYQQKVKDTQVRANIPEAPVKVNLDTYIQTDEIGEHTLYLMVDGIHCAACVWLIEHILSDEKDILHSRVNMTSKRLTLKWKGDKENARHYIQAVHNIGYRLMPFDPTLLTSHQQKEEKELMVCMATAGFAAANIMLLSVSIWSGIELGSTLALFMQWVSALIALPTVVYAGKPFYKSAIGALKAKRLNMDFPISLALILTSGLSLYEVMFTYGETYFDSVVMLLFFLLIGRYLDKRMRNKTYSMANHLLSLQNKSATKITKSGEHQTIHAKEVLTGDILYIHPGESLPVDGVIQSGQSHINNSLITGESLPLSVQQGDTVNAGAINLEGALTFKATAVGDACTLSKISKLIEESSEAKNAFTSIADKAARIYAPVVHLLAFVTFSYWAFLGGETIHNAILYASAVLIVTCPCALALSVPAVHVAVTSNLFNKGILLKNATAIERLKDIKAAIFDKTGTLTTGEFKLLENNYNNLQLAANLAKHSKHPLALSLSKHAEKHIPFTNIQEITGQGIQAEYKGKTVQLGQAIFVGETQQKNEYSELWFKAANSSTELFQFEDTIKPDAQKGVKLLQSLGIQTTLLSGDKENVVTKVAKQLGFNTFKGAQKPEDKHAYLKEQQATGMPTLMVGDGMNDAPALAESYVSISFANASEISQNSADIILQSPHVCDVAYAYKMAKKADLCVKLNFGLSISYNLVAIPLAMAGFMTPLYAALFMSFSSLMVMLNAMRLRK